MDKQKKGNTITIKINGKDRSFKENTLDSAKVDKQKKEEKKQSHLSEEVAQESAAAKEFSKDGESFDWILPVESKIPDKKEYKSSQDKKTDKHKMLFSFSKAVQNKNQEKRGLMTSIFLTVFFAVLLGTIFGLTVLNMVRPEKGIQEELPAVENDRPSETPVESGSAILTIPPLKTVVIQEGIYVSKDGAEQRLDELKQKNIPAQIIFVNGKFYLFVSVADSVEHAKTMESELKASGLITYAKEFVISEKIVTNLQIEESQWLESAPQYYQTLTASVTSAMISNSIPESMKEKEEKEAATLTSIDKEKLQKKKIIQLQTDLEAASAQLKIYEKNSDRSTLNLVKQHLLSFLSHYQTL